MPRPGAVFGMGLALILAKRAQPSRNAVVFTLAAEPRVSLVARGWRVDNGQPIALGTSSVEKQTSRSPLPGVDRAFLSAIAFSALTNAHRMASYHTAVGTLG
jgi:hypothetical protein